MRNRHDAGHACRIGLLALPLLFGALPLVFFGSLPLAAQTPPPPPGGGGEPPPQAYDDCRGKKAGDAISHTTPEGKVPAICVDSAKGLFARPDRPPPGGPQPPPGAPRN